MKHLVFLTKWYPDEENSSAGIFVHRHAEAAALYQKISLVHTEASDKIRGFRVQKEQRVYTNLTVYRGLYAKKPTPFSLLNKLIKPLLYAAATLQIILKIEQKIDVINAIVPLRTAVIAYLFKQVKGIPYTITEHWSGYLPEDGRYQSIGLKHRLLKFLIRQSSGLMLVSEALKTAMQTQGLTHANTQVIGNAIDPLFFESHSDVVPPPHPLQLLTVASLNDYEKNISAILKALAILNQTWPNSFRYHVVGSGPDLAEFQELTTQLNLQNLVTFYGNLPPLEVKKRMLNSHWLVLYSHFETFGCVVAEAQALGLPTIASNTSALHDRIINNPILGQLVEPNNPQKLADCLSNLIKNSTKIDKNTIKEYALKNYSYPEIGKLQQLFFELVGK